MRKNPHHPPNRGFIMKLTVNRVFQLIKLKRKDEGKMTNFTKTFTVLLFGLLLILPGTGCTPQEDAPRLSMFVGVDISGSFVESDYYENAIGFMARYIYAHLNGIDEFERPNVFFVGPIGGTIYDEPKTFHPIQTFQNKTVEEIEEQLFELFPTDNLDSNTDYNVFFRDIARIIQNHNLVLRPISVVMVTDGIPDFRLDGERHHREFDQIDLSPLERLSRNITIRVLYTDPSDGRAWETEVPRRRVKIWTQDAEVMRSWNSPSIFFDDERPLKEQERWIDWTMNNVNYNVRARRVD